MHSPEDGPVLQCPACGFSGCDDDFELVRVGERLLLHCPSCDANLGTREHALGAAA